MKTGDIIKARVTKVEDFGIFLEKDKKEILVTLSEMSWIRLRLPIDFTDIGEEHKVLLVKNLNTYFLGSIREAEPEKNPWRSPEVFKEGTIHTGTVDMNTDYGSFLMISEGVHALLLVEEGGGNLELGSKFIVEILSSCPETKKVTVKKKVM